MKEAAPFSWTVMARLLLLPLCLVWVGACSPEPTQGPGQITWNRDACAHCRMIIGERRDAAQVRSTYKHALHHFDDLGCALLWIDAQRSAGRGEMEELWVRSPAGTEWLDGLSARYAGGHNTPMGYGFRVAEGNDNALNLDEVQAQIRERERERRTK